MTTSAVQTGHFARFRSSLDARRRPVFSFTVTEPDGRPVHQQSVTRRARGGCACAGPYAHGVLGIDRARSDRLRADILAGHEIEMPGRTRLGFSVLMTDAKAARIIEAVKAVARSSVPDRAIYRVDEATARFSLEAI